MHAEILTPSSRWWYALKPASWPKVFVPAAFGQALGAAAAHRVSVEGLVFGVLWMVAHLAFVVLLNDWADQDVDALKRKMFPGSCGPKTVPDRILPADRVFAVGVFSGAAALAMAGAAAGSMGRPLLLHLGVLATLTFAAYSLPPLRLNYRGGGELVEMFGVGVLLPVLHHYVQSATLTSPSLEALLPCVALLALASALASGLSDETSDRLGGKKTFASTFGNVKTRLWVERLVLVACGSLAIALYVAGGPPLWLVLVSVAVLAFSFVLLRNESHAAITNAFEAQRAYKLTLHRATWIVMTLLAVGELIRGLSDSGAG